MLALLALFCLRAWIMDEFVDVLLLLHFLNLPIFACENARYVPFWRLRHPLHHIVLRLAVELVKYPACDRSGSPPIPRLRLAERFV